MIYIYFALFLGIVPAGLLLFRRKFRSAAAPLIWLIAIGTLYEIFMTLMLHFETALWFSTYDVLWLLLVINFFYRILHVRHMMYPVAVILLFAGMQLLYFSHQLPDALSFDTVTLIFTTGTVVVCSVIWFIRNALLPEPVPYLQLPEFYYISGMLLYHSATFLLFLMESIFPGNFNEIHRNFGVINVGASIIFRILFIIGVWKISKK